ncbi:hypothetical protein [Zunongwangia endophytica]|uniref:Outer membrane efflux protein n=1 Tax=Zunongwangia endophytica TaxID=1808945 RepID=A0ABV8HAW0_9FLAO|nr:hypothetical protein [Zunongwangia endophytica]MDN3593726.1 hypothetical protein [Zunongwangia endophytica]
MNSTLNRGSIPFNEALNKINQKHQIKTNEQLSLMQLQNAQIKRLAFTTDGGFCDSGNFYKELGEGLGTIKISYQDIETSKEKVLILNKMESKEEEIPLDFKINALYQKIEDAFCFYSQALDESKKLYFKNIFKNLCFHKQAYVTGLKAQYKLANYRRKQNGLKCAELQAKGKSYIIKRGLELQTELASLYEDVIPNIKDSQDRHTLESHLKYVIADKRIFSQLQNDRFMI